MLHIVSAVYVRKKNYIHGYFPNLIFYACDPLSVLDTVLPHNQDTGLEPYLEEVLFRDEEARQLARLRTLQSQQD